MFSSIQSQERLNSLTDSTTSSLLQNQSVAFLGTNNDFDAASIQSSGLFRASSPNQSNTIIDSSLTSINLSDSLLLDYIILTDDSLSTARSLGTLDGTLTRTGFVGDSDTQDFYTLNLTGSNLNITLTGLSSDADVELIRDLNNNGSFDTNEVIAYSSRGGFADESLNLSNLATGQYFVRVKQWFGDTNYTLRVSPERFNNLLAVENDLGILSNVRTLTDPSYSEGETLDRRNGISSTDTSDLFRFSLSSIRDVTLTLTGLSSDADLRLIQDMNNNGIVDTGEEIYRSSRGSTLNEAINKVLLAGDYFAQVFQYSGNTDYQLKLFAAAPQVNLAINQIQAIDNPDSGWFGDEADYYARITIDGVTQQTGVISNDNNIFPGWNVSQTVNNRYVSISIEVWDSDGGIFDGSNDHVDVDAFTGARNINLTYDLFTNSISGDISGYGGSMLFAAGAGDGDRARAWFTVDRGDWYRQTLDDTYLQSLTRNFAADGQLNRTDMMELMRETKDYGIVDATEVQDLRTILSDRGYLMPEYVRNLSNKVINSDPANPRSGIGNLYAGTSDTHMERLIGKWFLGNDRPTGLASGSGYRRVEGSLFRNGISYLDVDQNGAADCYLLAATGAVAFRSPNLISSMFIDNGDDTFTVRFYKPDGTADYVTVDRFLPTWWDGTAVYNGWGGGNNTNTNNELWVALLEKAFAQVNESGYLGRNNTNTYTGIDFGDTNAALQQLTGHDSNWHGLSSSSNANSLVSEFNAGKSISLCTRGSGTTSGIVENHCYTLIGYNAATDQFQVYNPWNYNNDSQSERWITRQQLLDNFVGWASIS